MNKHINQRYRKYLITRDNWKTFKESKEILANSIPEEDDDVVLSVRLRHKFGEEKGQVLINELISIRTGILKMKKEEDPGYGHSFEVFAIATLYDVTYKLAYNKYIIKGTEDGGIDAIYFDDDILKVYQIKLNELNNDYEERINNSIVEFQRNHIIKEADTHDLFNFLNERKDKIGEKRFDIVYICTNKKGSIKPLEIFKKYFNNLFVNHENDVILKLKISKNAKSKTFSISNINDQVYAFFYKANELIEDLIKAKGINSEENLYKYFDKNVRGILKENISMRKTILEDPNNFVKYNNGITITGTINYNEQNGILEISNPTISNGQQTVHNLNICRNELENVEVLIIAKNDDNPSIVDKIAKYTNTQTKIKSVDLLSLDKEIRKLQNELFNKRDDFFLDINTSGIKNYSEKAIKIYGKQNIISLSEFLKLYYGSFDKKIGKWKNSISVQVDDLLIQGIKPFDINKSIKVCEIIVEWKEYIARDKNKEHKLSDLTSMYIAYKYNKSIEESYKTIDKISKKYVNKIHQYKNIKELYRSLDIASIIDKEI